MKFWQFVGALVLLLVIGALIQRVVYTLRTGRDLDTDRATTAGGILKKISPAPAAAQEPLTAQPFDPVAALA